MADETNLEGGSVLPDCAKVRKLSTIRPSKERSLDGKHTAGSVCLSNFIENVFHET